MIGRDRDSQALLFRQWTDDVVSGAAISADLVAEDTALAVERARAVPV